MTYLLFTLLYTAYFLILGIGLRITALTLCGFTVGSRRLTGLLGHGFFMGLFAHVALLNGLQLFNLGLLGNSLVVIGAIVCFVTIIALSQFRGLVLVHRTHQRRQQWVVITLVAVFSLLLYMNSHHVPNLAWDTWTVWVARAKQWHFHGLSTNFVQPDQWLQQSSALLNLSSHYPDGISLIIYPIAMLFDSVKPALLGLTLVAYGFLVLLVSNRLEKLRAPLVLRAFMVIIFYSTPLLLNHILLPGYADLWMACFILLILLVQLDYNDQPRKGLRLTLIAYALMLPMLKLEGWVWLLIFFFSHSFIMWFNNKQRWLIFATLCALFILWFSLGGFTLTTPWGPFNVTPSEFNLFNKAYISFGYTAVTEAIVNGLFWQFNWSLLWFALPFLFVYMVFIKHNKAVQVSHLFFSIAFISFLVLFYLTPAAKYAIDYTAVNRILLQLVPCYIFLLFTMLCHLYQPQKNR